MHTKGSSETVCFFTSTLLSTKKSSPKKVCRNAHWPVDGVKLGDMLNLWIYWANCSHLARSYDVSRSYDPNPNTLGERSMLVKHYFAIWEHWKNKLCFLLPVVFHVIINSFLQTDYTKTAYGLCFPRGSQF